MNTAKSTTVKEIFTAKTILAGATAYSEYFDLQKLDGNASLQIELTGDGIGQFEWIGTNDEDADVADYIKPNGASDIVTAFIVTSGPGGDGKHIYPFNVSLVRRMAIKVTETSTTDPIVVTGILALQ